jgi:hypothetical protein
MLDALEQLLPALSGPAALTLALVGTALGIVLWLAGSRFARICSTLLAVLAGGIIGLELPRWFGLSASGAVIATVAAVVLGVFGYLIPRLWIGLALGATLSCWAMLACWMTFAGETAWTWPNATDHATPWAYVVATAQSLPGDVMRVGPWAVAASMLGGLAVALVWPKRIGPLAFSVVGLTLVVVLSLLAARIGNWQWRGAVPSATAAQIVMLAILSAFGAVIQTRSGTPIPKPAKGG